MEIRVAAASDIAAMHLIRLSVRENRLLTSTEIHPDDYRSMISERGRGWVAEIDGQIAGFAIADLVGANIWALFIDPAFEGRGLGRALHDTMVSWIFSTGVERVWLGTEPGTRAERFYRAAGWQYVETLQGEARYQLTPQR